MSLSLSPTCPPVWNIQICQSIEARDARIWLQRTLIVNSMHPNIRPVMACLSFVPRNVVEKVLVEQKDETQSVFWQKACITILAHASQIGFPPLLSCAFIWCVGEDKMRIKSKSGSGTTFGRQVHQVARATALAFHVD